MISKYSLLALGIGVYLAVAIVTFPASTAYRWFAPEELTLAVIEGTIWNGTAEYGGVAGLGFSDLRWQLHPAALLTGSISATAESNLPTGFARADVRASGSRVVLTDLTASTELASFRQTFPLGEISGQVSIALDRLEVVDGWPQRASGEVRVANLAIPPLIPMAGVATVALGNYQARFTAADAAGIAAAISDEGGPIELTGKISLAPDRSFVLDSLLRPRADAPPHLVQGIELMTGPPNAAGMRQFQLAGTL